VPMTVKMGLPPLWPGWARTCCRFPCIGERDKRCTKQRAAMHKRVARMRQWFRYDGEGVPSHSVVPCVHSRTLPAACLPSACATAEAHWRGVVFAIS
jgi:hypothetical protein